MTHTRNAGRLLALVMALAMVFSLTAAASAADDAVSVEFVLSSEGMEASAKIAVSPEEAALAIGAGLVLNGENFGGLTAYFNSKAAVLESSFLDKAYGVELEKLAENLGSSIFAPDSGTQFALDEDTYNQIVEMLSGDLADRLPEAAPEADVDPEALGAAANALTGALSQVMTDISTKLTMQVSSATLTVNGQEVPVSQVIASGDSETVLGIWDSFIGSLEGDAELQSAVAVLVDALGAYSSEINVTGEEFVAALLEQAPELRQSLADDLADAPIAISATVCTASESQQLVKLALGVTVGEDAVSGTLLMSEAQDFFRLEMDENGDATALQFDVTESTDAAFGFHFGAYEGEQEVTAVTFGLDKSAQTFQVGIVSAADEESEGVDTSLSGYYEETDDRFSLVIDKVNGEEFGGAMAMNLRSSDTLTFPSFTEITQLKETEFAAVLEALTAGLSSVSQLFS